jgi:Zn-dependent peptidase ImmA (M78 family)
MIAHIPAEQIRAALERVARWTLDEAGVSAPPVDSLQLAARLGLVVARDAVVDVRARFVRLGGGDGQPRPTIFVADDPRPERRQWAVAHEIGEHTAHRVFAELGVEPVDADVAARETVANRLASCLLLPGDWFFADGIDLDWDLFELKARYATASHDLVARRMLDMTRPVIVTLWDQGRQTWRCSNVPGRTPPLSPVERDAQHAAYEGGQPVWCDANELPDGVEDVRAWPIHEPLWKREIIRTQLAEVESW